MPKPHIGTLVYALAIIIVVVFVYHLLVRK